MIEMRVLGLEREAGRARCAGADGTVATVEVALVEPVAIGDVLLVQDGVALAHLEAETAT
jgi:hydrogenase maturation factor